MENYIRISALSHTALGMRRIKVIFKDGGWDNRSDDAEKIAYWMTEELYNQFGLGGNVTLQNFKEKAIILGCENTMIESENTDIYSLK